MTQQQLPLFGVDNLITYSRLTEFKKQEMERRGKILHARITALLLILEDPELKFERAQVLLQELNDLSLELSALDLTWVEFSDIVFEQIILPSKTSVAGAVRLLCGLYTDTIERT